jgi:hypothetical protein
MRKKRKQELYDQAKLCRKGVDVLVFGAATLWYSLIALVYQTATDWIAQVNKVVTVYA